MRSVQLRLISALSLATVVVAVGCSSSPASDTPDGSVSDAAIGFALQGLYITSSDGPLTQLNFIDDTHVDVTWANCSDGNPCTSSDTYVLSTDGSELTLTEPDGKTNVLTTSDLSIGAVEPSEQADYDLHILGGSLGGSTGGSLTGDSGTLTGTTGTLTHPGQKLVNALGVKLTNGCTQLMKSSGAFANDKTAFDFFRSKGLSAVQAAGVVGNLDQESGDSPTAVQPGGAGRGIAQWGTGQRWDTISGDNVGAYAKMEGLSSTSLQAQLDFTWYELSTFSKYGLASLEQQTTVVGAAGVFASKFELCGTCAQTKRNNYANAAYNSFAGDPVAGAEAGTCGGAAAYGTCTSSGKSGSCISTSSCSTMGGSSSAGHCPGPSSIQCCTK